METYKRQHKNITRQVLDTLKEALEGMGYEVELDGEYHINVTKDGKTVAIFCNGYSRGIVVRRLGNDGVVVREAGEIFLPEYEHYTLGGVENSMLELMRWGK